MEMAETTDCGGTVGLGLSGGSAPGGSPQAKLPGHTRHGSRPSASLVVQYFNAFLYKSPRKAHVNTREPLLFCRCFWIG
jgi:hypothetical protein